MQRTRHLGWMISLLALFALDAAAAPPVKTPEDARNVALVDIQRIFKNCDRHQAAQDKMKLKFEKANNDIQERRAEIRKMKEEVEEFKGDAAAKKKLDEKLVRREADLSIHIKLLQKEFAEREAKMIFQTYEQFRKAVDEYATGHDLDVVLRFKSEPVKPDGPNEVVQLANRDVVWHNGAIDITKKILDKLNGRPTESKSSALSVRDAARSETTSTVLKTPKAQPTEMAAAEKSPQKKPAAKKPVAKKPVAKKPAAKKKPAPKKKTVVRFTLKGSFPEGPQSEGLFGELQPTLAATISRIDQAAEDRDVAAVWLKIEGIAAGRGKINELRAAIARLRKARKPVYAELISATSPEYLLASACDEIFMPECGTLMLPGVRAEITFYKGLLDKLGVQFDMLQIGKYKGAAEPYNRTQMSGPLRESMEALVDDTYDAMAAMIGADRGMKDHCVKTLIDQGLFTPAAAKRADLIDHIQYRDEFEESLCKKLGVKELDLVTNYKKKKVDVDFSGLGGMMKMMELIMGGKPKTRSSGKKKIAIVYAVGVIVEGKSTTDILGTSALGSTTLVRSLRKAAEDDDVVAVVLRIDSPGGSAVASDLVWRQVVRTEKPVIASMGDVAGSGGYYIAMGADEIFAEPGTVTGSIGVVGGKLVLGGLYEKVGLKTEVISRGALSGSFSSTEPFTLEQRKAWMGLMQETYRQFVRKAAKGRKMTVQEMSQVAQGRVWSGRMAKEKGLVDTLGTLQDAVAAAKTAAGVKKGEEIEMMILPRPTTIFETLFGDPAGDLESALPEVIKPLRLAKLYRRLLTEPTLMWMPYDLQLK